MSRLHRLPLTLAALLIAVLAAVLPVPAGAADETLAAPPVERPAPPPLSDPALSKPALSKPAIAKPAIAAPQAPSAPQAPVVNRPASPAPLSPAASQPALAPQGPAPQNPSVQNPSVQSPMVAPVPGAQATDGPSGAASRPEPASDPSTLQRFFRSLQPDS